MAYLLFDSEFSGGSNDGSDLDNPYTSLTSLQSVTFSAGDVLICSNRSSLIAAANLQPNGSSDGDMKNWIRCIGWPRAAETGAGNFLQGSRVVSGIGTITPDDDKHLTRLIKCDVDGNDYKISALATKIDYDAESGAFAVGLIVTASGGATGMIHRVQDDGTTGSLWVYVISGTFADDETITDTGTGSATINGTPSIDGFILRKRYAGTTASSAACTISADSYYTEIQAAVDDTSTTVKKTDWDAHTGIPTFDFGATAYYFYMTGAYMWEFSRVKFTGGTSNGSLYARAMSNMRLLHCVCEQDQNNESLYFNADSIRVFLDHVVIRGTGSGSAQNGIYGANGGELHIKELDIYNMGNYGANIGSMMVYAEGYNSGIIAPNGGDDIVAGAYDWDFHDVELNGANGYVETGIYYRGSVNCHDWGGELGACRVFHANGQMYSVPVVVGSGDPQKRSGGSDTVMAVTMDQADTSRGYHFVGAMMPITHPRMPLLVWADTVSRTYSIYVQACNMSITDAAEFKLRAKYIKEYGAANAWIRATIDSSQTISERSSSADWSQYLSVTVQSSVAGWVELEILAGWYDADGIMYIDMLPVVS